MFLQWKILLPWKSSHQTGWESYAPSKGRSLVFTVEEHPIRRVHIRNSFQSLPTSFLCWMLIGWFLWALLFRVDLKKQATSGCGSARRANRNPEVQPARQRTVISFLRSDWLKLHQLVFQAVKRSHWLDRVQRWTASGSFWVLCCDQAAIGQ